MPRQLPKSKQGFDNRFKINLTDDQRDTLENWVSARLEDCLTNHATRDENIKRFRELYGAEDWDRELPFEGASNLHIPMIGWIVNALHVRLVQSHFGVKPYVRCKPQEASDQDGANILERLLWYVHSAQQALAPGYLAILDSLIAGYGVVKETWYQDYKRITEKGKPRFALRYNLPKKEYIRAEDFYVYPASADNIDNAQMVGHRFWRRYDDLVRGVCTGIYEEEWVKALEGKSAKRPETPQEEKQGAKEGGVDWKDMPLELFELVVSYDFDEDGLEEDYICVIERSTKTIIRWISYPYAYGERFYHTYIPFPNGTVYGDSLVGELEPLEEELSTLHNQRIDNNSFVNMPVFTVVEGTPAAKDDQKFFPGMKIPVNDHEDIKQLVTIPPRDGFGNDEDRIQNYAKLLSGISELNLGQTPRGEKTAYEIEASLAEGSIKIRLMVELGTGWLARMAWQEIGMVKQFMPDEVFERVTGSPNVLTDLKFEDLWAMFDFEPVGNTTTSNKELERQKWVFVREAFKGDPLVTGIDPNTGGPIDRTMLGGWWELDRHLLEAADVADYTAIIGQKPEAPVEQTPELPAQLSPDLTAQAALLGVPQPQVAPAAPSPDDLVNSALQGVMSGA